MIFGKTHEIKNRLEQELIKKKINGIEKFAWWPVELESGQWIWLHKFYAYWPGYERKNGEFQLRAYYPELYLDRSHFRMAQLIDNTISKE